MIALVQIRARAWSIADLDDDDLDVMWWCGRHGFVSPASTHWAVMPGCENVTFETRAQAERFARAKGWLS